MILIFIDDGGTDNTLKSSWCGSQRTGEKFDEADGEKTECNWATENVESDEIGRENPNFWILGKMNNIKSVAEEIVYKNILYA